MDESIKNKLINHQTTPPQGVWERIAGNLDEFEENKKLSARLLSFESVVPTDVWEKIDVSLNKPDQKILELPQKKKGIIISILKYAAAASIAGIIIFGINGLLINKNPAETIVQTEQPIQPALTDPVTEKSEIIAEEPNANTQNLTAENQSNQVTYASVQKNNVSEKKSAVRISNISSFSKSDIQTATIKTQLSEAVLTNEISSEIASLNDIENNRYLMFIGSDGNMIKMSKKIAAVLGCAVGPNLSVGINCMEQLNSWRERIASIPISASSDNFMDIINIVKAIKDTP